MNKLDKVNLIPRTLRSDDRGWFLKVIDGKEQGLPHHTGEVYLTLAVPGQNRGGHYHVKAHEWFTVVQGSALVSLADTSTHEQREMTLTATEPVTLVVPPGIAHIFRNPPDSHEPMLLVAYSDELYDPADTIPYSFNS
ncbi:polysaccharide biosynthesis C-terminal domain-containing protein [Coleofasciculus sp. F4-SAH-05]|uniref:polysaccharide biosynthesis C-terminal domain-containing protein n=1 Tax=Coleofasciculus sp. F4-SAH-05 TaxID=3069525 RepID=UPI0032F35939